MENNEQMNLFNFLKVFEDYENIQNKKNNLTDNIFSILGIERWEIKHSKFLAFLLDKERNGEIGTQFIEILLKKLKISNYKKLIKLDYKVFNEMDHTDILIDFPKEKVFVIENKVFSDEHGKQLANYRIVAEEKAREYNDKPKYIYLTPNKRNARDPENQDWEPIGYKDIYEILNNINIANNKLKYFLNDYIKILEVKVIKKDECEYFNNLIKAYKEDKKFLYYTDLILKYMPNYHVRLEICREVINASNDEGFILKKDDSQAYIFFYNTKIQKALKKKGISENLIKFQIHNNRSNGKYSAAYMYAEFDNKKDKDFAIKIKDKYKKTQTDSSSIKKGKFSFGTIFKGIELKKTEYETQKELRTKFANWIKNDSKKIIDTILSIINEI